MEYLHVAWHHSSPDSPVEIYSELDEQRWETRKVEVFADGRMYYADAWESSGKTGLSEVPIPPIEDIAAQTPFTSAIMDQASFERIWITAIAS